jgi:Glycine zipper
LVSEKENSMLRQAQHERTIDDDPQLSLVALSRSEGKYLKERDMQRALMIVLLIALATFFLGCSEPLTTREKGAGIGTFTGAGLGAIIGSATGNAGAGAGIGAAVGLVGGALIGDQMQARQKQEQDLQRQMAAQQAQIEQANREIQQLKAQQAR